MQLEMLTTPADDSFLVTPFRHLWMQGFRLSWNAQWRIASGKRRVDDLICKLRRYVSSRCFVAVVHVLIGGAHIPAEVSMR